MRGGENHSLQTMNMVWQSECSPHPLLKPSQAESNQGRKSKLLLAIYALSAARRLPPHFAKCGGSTGGREKEDLGRAVGGV